MDSCMNEFDFDAFHEGTARNPLTKHKVKPPDTRVIDPKKMRELRELSTAPHGWQGEGANKALMRALFDAKINGTQAIIPSWEKSYEGPDDRFGDPPPPLHYETISIVSVPNLTGSQNAAASTFLNVLPQCGYALRVDKEGARACVTVEGEDGPWHPARNAALAIMCALLGYLEKHPETAAAYREPGPV